MNNSKKYDVKDLYLASIKYSENNIGYGIFKIKQDVVNINTEAKYDILFANNNQILLEDGVSIKGITPLTNVITYLSGKYNVCNILKICENIVSVYNKEYEEFSFYDCRKVQETLAIIKPDGMKNATKIIEMIYNSGLSIKKYEVRKLDKEILSEHYAHLIDKPFYPELEQYMTSTEVIIMILTGRNAVNKFRELMGPTDSTKAPKGTIRGEFGTDIAYNAIHGSDSKENAEIEINRFFKQKEKRI